MENRLEELLNYFESVNEKEVLIKRNVKAFGYQFVYETDIYGSVSLYRFKDNIIEEYLTPIENDNRPGNIKESVQFVCVHDTASSAEKAGSLAHANYLFNGGGGTSWHYSVGDDVIYHSIPDNEVAFHAGDGTLEKFGLIDTGVLASGEKIEVTIEGEYYYINGQKTSVHIPVLSFCTDEEGNYFWTSNGIKGARLKNKERLNPSSDEEAIQIVNSIVLNTEKINDAGLHVIVGENGNYFMGKTYYSAGYGFISNRGGNLNSIGMETMINKGSNLYTTWQVTAKLCASLCYQNNLDISRVKPHHFFSGKPCPQTMRTAGLWPKFLKHLECEYNILSKYNDIKIEFISNDKEYLDDAGRVIKLPEENKTISYTVKVSDGKNCLSKTYYSNIIL